MANTIVDNFTKSWAKMRLTFRSTTGPQGQTQIQIEEIQVYSTYDLSGANKALGSTAVANMTQSGLDVNTMFDGLTNTGWAAPIVANLNITPAIVTVTFPTPTTIRAIKMVSGYPPNRPMDVQIEVSDDGTNWFQLNRYATFFSPANSNSVETKIISYYVAGTARLANGDTNLNIRVFEWNNPGNLVESSNSVIKNSNGEWFSIADSSKNYFIVYYTSVSGYRPMCDGPMAPQVL